MGDVERDHDESRRQPEVRLLAALRPAPPLDAAGVLQRVRLRLDAAMVAPTARRARGPLRRQRTTAPAGVRPTAAGFRRAVLAASAAAMAVCTAVVVPAVLPAGGPAPLVPPAWAIQQNSNGTVSVTVTTRAISDPGRLERLLAAAGVPAVVRFGVLCLPVGSELPQARAVISGPFHTGPYFLTRLPLFDPFEWRIDPAAMPPGSHLVISELHPIRTTRAVGAPLAIILVRDSQRINCSAAWPAGSR